MSGRNASPSKRTIVPTLRFRAKIILGFAAVLVISAGSMAFAYFGFERVSSGVGSYRSSVSEADLARNIDRELLAYRSAVRYFVVTGKEDDAKTALDAEDFRRSGRFGSAFFGRAVGRGLAVGHVDEVDVVALAHEPRDRAAHS